MTAPLDESSLSSWLSQSLHRHIPLSSAMHIEVDKASSLEVVLRAPLEPNHNHQGTAFGGSVHSLALLACWGLATLALKEAGLLSKASVVVQETSISYRRPIHGDFKASAKWSAQDRDAFIDDFRRKKKSKRQAAAEVHSGEEVCARLSGVFVALAP